MAKAKRKDIEQCAGCRKRFIPGHHGIKDIHGKQFCTPLCMARYYNRVVDVKA